MRSKNFSKRIPASRSQVFDSQIEDALKCVQTGAPVSDLCREVGISAANFYKWCANVGGKTLIAGHPYGAKAADPGEMQDVKRGCPALCVETVDCEDAS
jgi:Transposase